MPGFFETLEGTVELESVSSLNGVLAGSRLLEIQERPINVAYNLLLVGLLDVFPGKLRALVRVGTFELIPL